MYKTRKMPVWPYSGKFICSDIITKMEYYITTYGFITVLDLYDTIHYVEPWFETSNEYVDTKYGWTESGSFWVVEILDHGYSIRFKEPKLLPEGI